MTEALLGDWRNADHAPSSFVRLVVARGGDSLSLRAWGAGEGGPCDFGDVEIAVFEDDAEPAEVNGLTATFALGFQTVRVAGYTKRGVLCISTFTTFAPGDPRSPYYTREFFHRVGA